jgi:hypothetical protein
VHVKNAFNHEEMFRLAIIAKKIFAGISVHRFCLNTRLSQRGLNSSSDSGELIHAIPGAK